MSSIQPLINQTFKKLPKGSAPDLSQLTNAINNASEELVGKAQQFTFQNIIFVLALSIVIYWLLCWLFSSDAPKESTLAPTLDISITKVNQPEIVRDRREVFNIKDDVYSYHQGQMVCQQFGARLATSEELARAHSNGANWCSLGWLQGQQAYYPTQFEQIQESEKWPRELREACGKVGLNGGSYPAQLKLSVNCYGIKPTQNLAVTPFNTLTRKWSQYT